MLNSHIVQMTYVQLTYVQLDHCLVVKLGNWLDGRRPLFNLIFVQSFLGNERCSDGYVRLTGHHRFQRCFRQGNNFSADDVYVADTADGRCGRERAES